jgi:hypothetical protein
MRPYLVLVSGVAAIIVGIAARGGAASEFYGQSTGARCECLGLKTPLQTILKRLDKEMQKGACIDTAKI